jgi:hypothetical protein
MSGARRGGIPGPESRTGLLRPAMTEAEFERRQGTGAAEAAETAVPPPMPTAEAEAAARGAAARVRGVRGKPARPRRLQRMFAVEEELDKKLWLYAIHVGKDRSEVINDLLRPLVASMVLYDSRDRRSAGRAAEVDPEGQGGD